MPNTEDTFNLHSSGNLFILQVVCHTSERAIPLIILTTVTSLALLFGLIFQVVPIRDKRRFFLCIESGAFEEPAMFCL